MKRLSDHRVQRAAAACLLLAACAFGVAQSVVSDAAPAAPASPAVQPAAQSAGTSSAQAAPAPVAAPMVEEGPSEVGPPLLTAGVWAGEDLFEGRFDALVPLLGWSDGDGELLGDARALFGDAGEQEVSLGVVARQRCPDGRAIFGLNAFYDSRWTSNDSHFNQLGLGAEVLTKWVDARANLYMPEDDRDWFDRDEETTLVRSSDRTDCSTYAVDHQIRGKYKTTRTDVYRHDLFDFYEVALEGYDAEIGVKLPLDLANVEARVFVGYYDFEPTERGDGGADDVSGVKGRVELRAWNRLFAGAELFEDDELYGSDFLVSAFVRVPLERGAVKSARAGDYGAYREEQPYDRMHELVMRDPRVKVGTIYDLEQWEETRKRVVARADVLILDNVIFVDGDLGGAPGEDGSAALPFDLVQEGVDESAYSGMPNVYVFGATQPYRENVEIGNAVNLYGEGHRFVHCPSPGRGLVPVIEGFSEGPFLAPVGVLEVHDVVGPVVVAGFEITAAPYAGGPWTSPFDAGGLSPLVGIFSVDSDNLTVMDNTFRNLAAGVVAFYGPVPYFDLVVQNNLFENVGLGVGAAFDTAGYALIQGNTMRNTLLGIGVVGWESSGRAEVDILGNTIQGTPVDVAQILPYPLFEDLLLTVVPAFPLDHPQSLPIPSIGGIVAVAGPQADMGVDVMGNTIEGPAVGILGLALSPNLFGAGLSHNDALTTLDMRITGNRLVGGGLDPLYQLALDHAGTIAALVTGNYGVWTPDEVALFGDMVRDALPASLGFDAGLLGIGVLSLGDGAEVNDLQIADNVLDGYFLGIGAVAADEGWMRDLAITDNLLRDNLLGVLGLAVADGDMRRATLTGNQVLSGGLGALNPILADFGLTLIGPDPIQLPEIGLAGIALVGIGDANLNDFTIRGNFVRDSLLGIGVVAAEGTQARDGQIVNNYLEHNLLGIAGLSLFDGNLRHLEIGNNTLIGGGTIGAIDGILGGILDPVGGYDPGISGIALVAVEANARDFDIHDNLLAYQAVGIGVVGVDANLRAGRIADNEVHNALVGILGLGIDNTLLQNLEISGNLVQGGGVVPIASLIADDPAALPDGDAGIVGIGLIGAGSDLDRFEIRDNIVHDEALGIAFVGIDSQMRSGRVEDNLVDGSLAGIVGVAVAANLREIIIDGNTVAGAGLPGTLQLAEATLGLSLGSVGDLDLPDWGVLGIGLIGIDNANVDQFLIRENTLSRNAAGIVVAGIGNSSMVGGRILSNDSTDHLLGVTALAIGGSNLSGLNIFGNELEGSGLDTINPLLASAPTPMSLHDVGAAGIAMLAANGGLMTGATVENNRIDDHVVGVLGVGLGDTASLNGLVVVENTLDNHAMGVLLAGVDGAGMQGVNVTYNQISDSLVGVLASASRTDGAATRTPMNITIANNTISGDDSLLVDGFTTLSLVSLVSGNGTYGIPAELLGTDGLLVNPIDMLTVFPGLDTILPGGFDPLLPPSLGDIVQTPAFEDLLGGQGLAGVMVHFGEADDVSSATVTANTINNIENGIYAVVTDPSNAAVVDITATGNTSQDNVVIGEDTTRADYNLVEVVTPAQEAFVELPTP